MSGTTRALVFLGPGRPLELREFATPEPEGSEVLVEVIACTLCGSDLHTIQGRRNEPTPTVLGHEILGRIVAFGPTASRRDAGGSRLEPGDRVTWAIVASCGDCYYCDRALPQKCDRRIKYGHEPLAPRLELTGGLAEHCLLAPGSAIFRVPDGVADEVACPANCATATVAGAIEAAGELSGRSVLILGSGMLGVTACAWAASLGASDVIACDRNAERRALARTFGASLTVDPGELAARVLDLTQGRGVDVVIELTGAPEAFEGAEPLVRMGGTIVLVGATYPARSVELNLEQVVRRCLTIKGLHNYAPRHLKQALEFLEAHPELPFAAVVGPWQRLENVAEAVEQGLGSDILRLAGAARAVLASLRDPIDSAVHPTSFAARILANYNGEAGIV